MGFGIPYRKSLRHAAGATPPFKARAAKRNFNIKGELDETPAERVPDRQSMALTCNLIRIMPT